MTRGKHPIRWWIGLRSGGTVAGRERPWIDAGDKRFERKPTVYQPRYLSDSGRLFSTARTHGVAGHRRFGECVWVCGGGVGGCSGSSVTFGGASDGCGVDLVRLFQRGIGVRRCQRIGRRHILLTAGRLVAQDQDEALDVYDAHVCGGEGVACPVWSRRPLRARRRIPAGRRSRRSRVSSGASMHDVLWRREHDFWRLQ